MSDEPIIPHETGGGYVATVIDLAGIRIQRGHSKIPRGGTCPHKAMTYDPRDRRVWCKDCERTIDNFDAFAILAANFEAMERQVKSKLSEANAAMQSAVRRRATKAIDHAWSGNVMAICCPHCRGGLLPEDFLSGGMRTSRELEMARRKRAAAAPVPTPRPTSPPVPTDQEPS